MVIDCGAPSTCEGYRVKQDLLRFLEPLGEKEVFISSIQNYLEIAPPFASTPASFSTRITRAECVALNALAEEVCGGSPR